MSEANAAGLQVRWPFVLIGVAGLLLAVIHQAYVTVVHPAALYMDSLRLLSHLYEWEHGRMSILDIWGYGRSTHHGLITQAILYANVKLLSLDVMAVNRMTGLIVLAVGLLIALPYLRQSLRESENCHLHTRLAFCYFAALFIAMGYSLAGFELFTLDLGLPLWFKNFCFVAYFTAHAHLLRKPSLTRAVVLGVLAPVIVLMVGMGWSYAFVGAILAVHILAAYFFVSTARSTESLLTTFAVVVAGATYVVGGGGASDGITFSVLVQKFPSAFWLTCHAIGSTFIGNESAIKLGIPHWALGVTGLFMVLAMLVMVSRNVRQRYWPGSLLPMYLIGYGGLVAVSVSYARGDAGYDAVMASRYYMDLYLFTVGVFWIWSEYALKRGRLALVPLVAVQLLFLSGQLATQWIEWHTAPYRRAAIAAMNAATSNGVNDEVDARLLQSPLPDARRGVAAMRMFGVGVFQGRKVSVAACSDELIRALRGWYGVENGSLWMSQTAVLSVPSCGCPIVSNVYLPPNFSSREITVLGDDKREVAHVFLKPGETQVVHFPRTAKQSLFQITASSVTVPKRDLVGNNDLRELSAIWTVPTFECSTSAL